MLSECHDNGIIYLFLQRSFKQMTKPKEAVCDQSLALISGIDFEIIFEKCEPGMEYLPISNSIVLQCTNDLHTVIRKLLPATILAENTFVPVWGGPTFHR